MIVEDLFEICDAILITSPHNLRYFSGFTGGEGYAIIGKEYKALFVDFRYTVEAKCECVDVEVYEYSGGHLFDSLKKYALSHNIKKFGFEDEYLTYDVYGKFKENMDDIEFVPLERKLDVIRAVKGQGELTCLREAEKIGDIAFKNVLPLIKVGMTENDLAAEIEYQMRKQGASSTSFDTIAVSGIKTAMPHGKPSEKKIEYGDFVTMDFGCVYKGYCSDMTRTIVMGDASKEQCKIYDIVLKAQMCGLSALRSGVSACEVDRAARKVIEDAGYGANFGHSLGHGVGLLIHELPNLSPRSDMVLAENMVVTCEPGIYIENFGGVRIEDMVIVKKDGVENLTSSSKDLYVCV